MTKRKLGEFIEQTDIRNKDLKVSKLLGVSIDKVFIESHANIVGVDFSNYKIVKKGEFAYGPVTSRNGDKISIARLVDYDECLISSSYTPFKVIKENELSPDYLMLIFRNPEFDRYARYNSWGSAREVFSWEDFCNTEIEVPSIQEQEKIVQRYKVVTDRIEILNKINKNLQDTALCIYKELTLKKEKNGKLREIIKENNKSKIKVGDAKEVKNGKFVFYTSGESILSWNDYLCEGINCYLNTGGSASVKYYDGKAAYSTDTWSITGIENFENYLYLLLVSIEEEINEKYFFGTGLKHLQKPSFKDIEIYIPSKTELSDFNRKTKNLFKQYNSYFSELLILNKIKDKILPMF